MNDSDSEKHHSHKSVDRIGELIYKNTQLEKNVFSLASQVEEN